MFRKIAEKINQIKEKTIGEEDLNKVMKNIK